MRLSWLGVFFVIVLLLLPAAGASHNMGHRYLVHGRVLDASGMPVQNQEVEIQLKREGTLISSIITSTDCFGDFDSWKGRVGYRGVGDGGGTIEGPLGIPGGQGQYVNFHFHDADLSSLNRFELKALNSTWEVGFNSRTRQTSSFHQLDATAAPASSCGGNYDQFNSTFEVRVFIAHVSEMTSSREPSPPTRTVNVAYATAQSNGTVDFQSTYVAKLQNVTVSAGQRVEIQGTTLGGKTETISDEEAKFRRLDSINAIDGAGGPSFAWLKTFGIILIIGVVLIGGYIGMKKMKAKRDEARLMQGSTRRRFRKERGGPGGES